MKKFIVIIMLFMITGFSFYNLYEEKARQKKLEREVLLLDKNSKYLINDYGFLSTKLDKYLDERVVFNYMKDIGSSTNKLSLNNNL